MAEFECALEIDATATAVNSIYGGWYGRSHQTCREGVELRTAMQHNHSDDCGGGRNFVFAGTGNM